VEDLDAVLTMAQPRSTENNAPASQGATQEGLKFKHVFTRENPGKIEDYFDIQKKILGEGSYGQVTRGTSKRVDILELSRPLTLARFLTRNVSKPRYKFSKSLTIPTL
jgi:hypothetical protein